MLFGAAAFSTLHVVISSFTHEIEEIILKNAIGFSQHRLSALLNNWIAVIVQRWLRQPLLAATHLHNSFLYHTNKRWGFASLLIGVAVMAIGERIHFIRNLRRMTQKYLGILAGFPEKTADIRMAQYESGTRTPKADVTNKLTQILKVSPRALDLPNIDSKIGLMHWTGNCV